MSSSPANGNTSRLAGWGWTTPECMPKGPRSVASTMPWGRWGSSNGLHEGFGGMGDGACHGSAIERRGGEGLGQLSLTQ